MKSSFRHSMYLAFISAMTCLSAAACFDSGAGDELDSMSDTDEVVGEVEEAMSSAAHRISYWPGKVNTHINANGIWVPDSDCVSGSGILPLPYCQKFYPNTTSVTPVELSKKPPMLWNTRGCGSQYTSDGVSEWICNEPAPPRISYFQGKVNLHRDSGGTWTKDSDCSSGAQIDPLVYCQKFYPATTSVTSVPVTTKPALSWNTAGCYAQYSGDGLEEFTCNP